MTAAATINIGLNLILIPRFGMMGAAVATTVAFLLLAVGTGLVSNAHYPVEYEYVRVGKSILAGAAVYGAALLIETPSMLLNIASSVLLPLVGYPVALMLLGFFDRDEKQALRTTMSSAMSRLRSRSDR